MTDVFATSQLIAAWLQTNDMDAPPLAVLRLTNIVLQAIENTREKAYQQGLTDARKDNHQCKQP